MDITTMIYKVKHGDTLSRIASRHGLTLTALLAVNPQDKAEPNRIHVGDEVSFPEAVAHALTTPTVPRPPAFDAPPLRAETGSDDDFHVPFGQLTFDAEGLETPGRFFSRVAHEPSSSSGLTLGRGYDMREREVDEIIANLTAAGIARALAERFVQGRSLRGNSAKRFFQDNGLDRVTITPTQQKHLFLITYKELAGDVVRIGRKADVVAKYGSCDWPNLAPRDQRRSGRFTLPGQLYRYDARSRPTASRGE
jgi:LysM repeat protein